MYFYHPWEDPTTTNPWEANADCQRVEDEDGGLQFAGVLTNIKKEISCKRTQVVTDQQWGTETATTAQNGSLLGNM